MFLLNNLIYKLKKFNNLYKDFPLIFSIICFFFLWDIKFNIYQNFFLSYRELFYLILIFLIFDYKKSYNTKLIKISLFFLCFLFFNLIIFNLNFDQLDFRYNILPIIFLFLIFFICDFYQKEILQHLNLAFLLFIYLLILSYLFSDIYFLSPMEKTRICGLFSFKIKNQFFFLEPSHMAMILVPFYYYIFILGNINYLQKIILLIFLSFIFLFSYSLTLLLSVFGCLFLMLLIDYRFFTKNKLFFLCQLLILITPIFEKSCVYKANNVFENLNYITEENKKYTFYIGNEKYSDIEYKKNSENIDEKKSEESINVFISELSKNEKYVKIFDNNEIKKDLQPFIDDDILAEKMDYWNFRQTVMQKYKDIAYDYDEIANVYGEQFNWKAKEDYENLRDKTFEKINTIPVLFDEIIKLKIMYLIPYLKPKDINYFIVKNNFLFSINLDSKINDHTSAVLINSFKVAYHAMKEKPFGWGFNNYQSPFNKFMLEKIVPKYPQIYYLNHNDGSNNFIKLIVEFGIFSLLIFFNLMYFTLNKKIHSSQRILFGGIIFIQMMRGAGYFNGGFILCLIFTFILNFQSLRKNEQ